jgi:hypothetical protein
MLRKLLVSLCLVSLLTIGTGALVASAHMTPNSIGCHYALVQNPTTGSYARYQVSVYLYEYITTTGAYCGKWETEVYLTIPEELGPGSITGILIDGNGKPHPGTPATWDQSSGIQYRVSTSPTVDTGCARGQGHLQLKDRTGTTRDFTTPYICHS